VTRAAALGFGRGTPIYYDMEAYPPRQKSNALAFLSAWTKELHAKGCKSGVYSSSSSGITDVVRNATKYAMPFRTSGGTPSLTCEFLGSEG
jgi:glycoside hydrolase-like protein